MNEDEDINTIYGKFDDSMYKVNPSKLWENIKGYINDAAINNREITEDRKDIFEEFFPPLTKFLAASEDLLNVAVNSITLPFF